jgi:hypothetical protein
MAIANNILIKNIVYITLYKLNLMEQLDRRYSYRHHFDEFPEGKAALS